MQLRDRIYIVGYSQSLVDFLQSIKEDVDFSNATGYIKACPNKPIVVYHNGHRQEVKYWASEIKNNERVFIPVEG